MKRSYSSGFFEPKKSKFYNFLLLQEKYNKTNEQLLDYIKSKERTINISNKKPILNIRLYNNSLINIFNKINDEYFFIQDFLKLIIMSEKRDTISIESKESFDKYITLLDNKTCFNIKKSYNNDDNNRIQISKKSLLLIFKLLGIKFGEEILFSYIEIMIYEEITEYHFEEYKNLGELIYNIYNNTFGKNSFYILNNNNNIVYPITNYSIKKITNMLNINDTNINNNKFFRFLLKDINVKLYREKNKYLLERLSNKNDYKFIYNKYHDNYSNCHIIDKWKNIENNNIISRMQKSNIIELNDFLFSTEQLLNKTLSNLEKNKRDLHIKISNENNYFIPIKDINHNTKYINLQYIKLINKKLLLYNPKDNYNQFMCHIPDFTGKMSSISINNEEINNNYLDSSTEKYICILNNNTKYLVKVNNIQNLLNNYKIINKKYQFNIELPEKEEKKFSFNEIKINEQSKIRSVEGKIIKTYKKNIVNNNNNNVISNEIKNNNEEGKQKINKLILNISEEPNDIIKDINDKKFQSKFSLYNNFNYKERRNSEFVNSETNDSNDSVQRISKLMQFENGFNIFPEKGLFFINKVIKIKKKDKNKKVKKDI